MVQPLRDRLTIKNIKILCKKKTFFSLYLFFSYTSTPPSPAHHLSSTDPLLLHLFPLRKNTFVLSFTLSWARVITLLGPGHPEDKLPVYLD